MSLHGPYLREAYFCSLDTSVLNSFHCSSSHVGTELNVGFFLSTQIKVDVEFRSELIKDSALFELKSVHHATSPSVLSRILETGFWMLKQAKRHVFSVSRVNILYVMKHNDL